MRKLILKLPVLLIFASILSVNAFSFSIVKHVSPENNISPANIEYLHASVFVKLSAREFETITGKKLNLAQKIYLKFIQRKLKRDLKKNADLLITDYYDPQKAKFKFDFLWFIIAGFIGPLGVLLAYTYKPRKGGPARKNVITSAWLGFAGFVLWFGFLFFF